MVKTIRIIQTRSVIGRLPKHKVTLLGLGLHRIGYTIEREDTPAIHGMINVVSFTVGVEEQETHLNTLSPAEGPKRAGKRLGRGIGSGFGKTGGHGHRGQKSRPGGGVRRGFGGGWTPLHRHLPKFGFTSRKAATTTGVCLFDLAKVEGDVVDLNTLKTTSIIGIQIKSAKVILAGEVMTPATVRGLCVTRGARAAIEAAGGKIEE